MSLFTKILCGSITIGAFVLVWIEHWLAHIAVTLWILFILAMLIGAMNEIFNQKIKKKPVKKKPVKKKK